LVAFTITDANQLSNDVSYLVNTALNTIQIKKLTIQENENKKSIRPNFHVFFRMPIGSGKSTIINEVAEICKSTVISGITRAGLIGTIDKTTQQYIAGYSWECRNNLGLFDEMNFGRKQEGEAEFLQLLESGMYSKRFGLYSGQTEEEDGDLYFRVSKGKIDLKTRFSAVICSMKKLELMRGQYFRALISRCNPYNYCPNINVLSKIADGHKIYVPKKIDVPEKVIIPNKIYNQIHSYVHKILDEEYFKHHRDEKGNELYLRSIGDVCRSYAVWNNLDRMEDIVNWKIETNLLIGKYFKKDFEKEQLKGILGATKEA
jgi:hypothetical protein